MRAKQWLEFLILVVIAAMPLAAQSVPMTVTVTAQVPAFYRLSVNTAAIAEVGLPVVSMTTNQSRPGRTGSRQIIAEHLTEAVPHPRSKGGGPYFEDAPGEAIVRYTVTSP